MMSIFFLSQDATFEVDIVMDNARSHQSQSSMSSGEDTCTASAPNEQEECEEDEMQSSSSRWDSMSCSRPLRLPSKSEPADEQEQDVKDFARRGRDMSSTSTSTCSSDSRWDSLPAPTCNRFRTRSASPPACPVRGQTTCICRADHSLEEEEESQEEQQQRQDSRPSLPSRLISSSPSNAKQATRRVSGTIITGA
ncbi:expressed unknown protein [Seminavis robusta]|uniref:Sushi domain-containing protein n=1 Tax=Seminavis robusta TaxID=568900 RepID=A0A9N8DLL5_9STRA|nr:expressed unknown protein [Seminavis robusta]|eukprot:Sro192_g082550.1 n/a (195) ;mRNA; f:82750-83334